MTKETTRRSVLRHGAAGIATLASPALLTRRARAAEYSFKLATTILPDHPINVLTRQAAAEILSESKGRVAVTVFPGYQLGSSTSVMSSVRAGSIEMAMFSGAVLANLLPVSSIYNLAFAFKDYGQVWTAMDGKMGDYVRQKIEGVGLHPLDKIWNLGFRQITTSSKQIRTPEDLKGVKIRVAVAPLFLSCFNSLGAASTSLNFNELFTALQTKVVDGEENDLLQILKGNLYEVQKYCALSNHIWEGYYFFVNGPAWNRLPPDMKDLVAAKFNAAAVQERQALIDALQPAQKELAQKGLVFNDVDREAFKAALVKAGFYAQWKKTFGTEVWTMLQDVVGPLG